MFIARMWIGNGQGNEAQLDFMGGGSQTLQALQNLRLSVNTTHSLAKLGPEPGKEETQLARGGMLQMNGAPPKRGQTGAAASAGAASAGAASASAGAASAPADDTATTTTVSAAKAAAVADGAAAPAAAADAQVAPVAAADTATASGDAKDKEPSASPEPSSDLPKDDAAASSSSSSASMPLGREIMLHAARLQRQFNAIMKGTGLSAAKIAAKWRSSSSVIMKRLKQAAEMKQKRAMSIRKAVGEVAPLPMPYPWRDPLPGEDDL